MLRFLVLFVLLGTLHAQDCPCAPNPSTCSTTTSLFSSPSSLSYMNITAESRKQFDPMSCGYCIAMASILQETLRPCCSVKCPTPQYACECQSLLSLCMAEFAIFPKLLQECENDMYSVTYGDIKYLEDPFFTPYGMCVDMGLC